MHQAKAVLDSTGEPITVTPFISLKKRGKSGTPANNEVRNQRNRWRTCNRFTWQNQDCKVQNVEKLGPFFIAHILGQTCIVNRNDLTKVLINLS